MAKVISFYNYKGGCGKTFTALNVAVGFANKHKKTLIVDLDPQSNTSLKFFDDFENIEGINEVIVNKLSIKDVIRPSKVNNLDVVPSKTKLKLAGGGVSILEDSANREFLKIQIKKIENDYDYIIFDNNPWIEIFLRNITFCSDLVIIPVGVDLNAISGVNGTIDVIKDTISSTSMDLNCDYKILLTMIGQTRNGKDFTSLLKETYQNKILNTTIRFQKKPAEDQTIDDNYFAINDNKPISNDLKSLVDEIEKELA